MNQNPWYVDNAAEYERERIRSEMKQIRMEERARRAQPRPGRLVLRVWHLLFKERVSAAKQAAEARKMGAASVGLTKRPAKLPR